MAGRLTGDQRSAIALLVWPEIEHLGIGFLVGHGLIVEAVLDGDPTAPVTQAPRA